jgi:phosphoribosylformimino-5-aminoimidazole carboxamide ribotide isomerase
MDILPAIDLRGGRCVRLRQGRYDDETVFDDDPVAVARRFEKAGARWLHVVDLDGARAGKPVNLDTIRRIVEAVGLAVEVGGGIRTTEVAGEILGLGVRRAIVGTRAVREPEWLRELAGKFPGRIALGLDARQGHLAVQGWECDTASTPVGFAVRVRDWPLGAIIYTQIERDGMMTGPDVEATRLLAGAVPFPVIASGGVTTVDDIVRLRKAGISGAIVGRAIYEGKITVEAALEAARESRGDA